jgi:hypothetical protein
MKDTIEKQVWLVKTFKLDPSMTMTKAGHFEHTNMDDFINLISNSKIAIILD